MARLAPPGVRLLFFGGKGGVGKTTCAAAVGLLAAAARPRRRVLLLSTDPAHSLGDAFAAPLGDEAAAPPGAPANLSARELDAAAAFERFKTRYRRSLEAALGALSPGGAFDARLDREVLERLFEVTPPGLDELVAVAELTGTLGTGARTAESGSADGAAGAAADLVIVDTAPTGHALRLLEMPELALAWDHALMSLVLKYRQVLPLGELAPGLLELAREVKDLQALLADPRRCRFAAVTRAGELPRRETERLLAALPRLGLAVAALVVNAVALPGCPRCARAAAAHRRAVARLRRACPCAILLAPARFPPPRGAEELSRWGRSWSAEGG